MIFPIQHERMSARRWPVVTIALIVLNLAVLLLTNSANEENAPALGETKAHLFMLAAQRPDLKISASGAKLVTEMKAQFPHEYEELRNPNHSIQDGWEARMRMESETAPLQAEMDRLCTEFDRLESESLIEKYGFVPAHPTLWSYLTATFMHGGWMHLIGNMWFLWLAGFVLEDTWGRAFYSAFYLAAGVAALFFHAAINPASTIPCVGASGAVAGLMGAFLVRFPKMKIELGWLRPSIYALFRGRVWYRFKAPAYALLPLWLLVEIFFGGLTGSRGGGVAHWAHVGGFIAGAVVATGVRFSGFEAKLEKKIEEKTSWTENTEIEQAGELLQSGKPAEALAVLDAYVAANANSLEGWGMWREAKWRMGDTDAYLEATAKMCAIDLAARDYEHARQTFGEFESIGGAKKFPSDVWMQYAMAFEQECRYDEAVAEYSRIAAAYAGSRDGVRAQIAAARITQMNLERPAKAAEMLEAADRSAAADAELKAQIAKLLAKARGSSAASVPFAKPAAVSAAVAVAAAPQRTRVAGAIPITVSTPEAPRRKPRSWGDLDAPPVWGHGAKGDTIHKPEFTSE